MASPRCTSWCGHAAATVRSARSTRALPAWSSIRRRTRSTPRSPRRGSARASGSPSPTPSTTWRRSGTSDDAGRPGHRRRHRHRRRNRAAPCRRGLPGGADRPAAGTARGPGRRDRRHRDPGRRGRTGRRRAGRLRDDRRHRPARRPGVQRGDLPPRQRPRADPGAMGRGDPHEPDRRLPDLPGGAPPPARAGRQHRHDRLAGRTAGVGRLRRLLHLEGGARHADALPGRRSRPAGGAGQLHRPRLGAHSDGRFDDGADRNLAYHEPRRRICRDLAQHPHTASGDGRGGGRPGRLAGEPAGGIDERRRHPSRRGRQRRRRRLPGGAGMSTVAGIAVSPDHYIGGRRVPSEERFEDRSPIDWSLLAEVARGGQAEVDMAVDAATEAFPAWAALGAAGRAVHLRRLADLIDANIERLATVECLDMAMLERSLRARVIGRGARNYRAYADLAAAYEERVWESNGTRNRVIRMPSGPAAVITPWNAPFMLSTWKTAPGLAAGCTVILKPAEWSPLSCSLLADLAGEAGLPPGVFNVVQGIGEEAGAALVSHPGVRRVSFTGSPETGRLIGAAAAGNLVPFTAELGGKGPLIVFEDADIDAAARKAAGQYDDAGQVCLAGTRLLVADPIRDEFLERFHRHTDAHVLGDPRADDTTVSPLIHPEHLARVEGFVERARANGDQIVRGGHVAEIGGVFFQAPPGIPQNNDSADVPRGGFCPGLAPPTLAAQA